MEARHRQLIHSVRPYQDRCDQLHLQAHSLQFNTTTDRANVHARGHVHARLHWLVVNEISVLSASKCLLVLKWWGIYRSVFVVRWKHEKPFFFKFSEKMTCYLLINISSGVDSSVCVSVCVWYVCMSVFLASFTPQWQELHYHSHPRTFPTIATLILPPYVMLALSFISLPEKWKLHAAVLFLCALNGTL